MAEPTRINVVGEDGEAVSIPAEQLEAAQAQGYRPETPEEAAHAAVVEKYGDSPVLAGLAGAGRGVTLGASDWLLTKSGAVAPETLDGLREANPTATTVGEIAGAVAPALIPGGQFTAAGALARGGAGVAKALGGRLAGRVAAGVLEGGLAGAGQLLTEESLHPNVPLTAERVMATVGLGGALGGAGGAAGKLLEDVGNVDEIQLPADGAKRTAAEVREHVQKLMHETEGLLEDARQKALSKGIDPDDMGVGRSGEFLSKGSKLDDAQKASLKVKQYQRALESLRGQADELDKLAPDALIQTVDPQVAARQAALKADPRLIEAKQNVLKNNLAEFDSAVEDAAAKRVVYEQAKGNLAQDAEQRAADLLSGKAALDRVGQLASRYAPPLVGSLAGTVLGGPVGAAAGAAVGALAGGGIQAAVGGLAGAGMRPAFQSMMRTFTEYPAVKNALGKFLQGLVRESPDKLGAYAPLLSAAGARGLDGLVVAHVALSALEPSYREQMASAGLRYDEDAAAMSRARPLSVIDAAAQRASERRDALIDSFLRPKKAAGAEKSKSAPKKSFEERAEELNTLMANPQAMQERLAATFGGLGDHAPAVVAAAMATAQRGVQFLHAAMPKPPTPALDVPALRRPWKPSDAEKSKWERMAAAVDDPHEVLRDMAGGFVTQEAVQALQAVYPELLEDTRSAILERLASHGTALDYAQRLALGHVLGQPVDEASQPQRLAALQATFAAPPPQAPPRRGGGSSPSSLASDMQSDTERLTSRRS